MADRKDVPFVTLAVPCFNEERFIEAFLTDVLQQDYPVEALEVLIGDGMSTDRTRELIDQLSERHPGRFRVIDNPRRLQAAGMNAMIAEARGEIIVRMDVHARYATDYVAQCVAELERTGAQNVGGSARAMAEGWFQKALCAALDSPLAVGGARYRKADAEGFVDTVFPGAFRRNVFSTVGGYDANAITNEDAELNQRILAGGGRIYLSPRIIVHYVPRDSFGGLARQYFKYGKGRARTLLKHRGLPTVRPVIPFAMVLGGAALLLTSAVQPATPVAFGIYGLASSVEALRVSWRHGLRYAPIVAAIFPVLHVSHGVGFGVGLIHYALHPDWADAERAPRGSFEPVAARPGAS